MRLEFSPSISRHYYLVVFWRFSCLLTWHHPSPPLKSDISITRNRRRAAVIPPSSFPANIQRRIPLSNNEGGDCACNTLGSFFAPPRGKWVFERHITNDDACLRKRLSVSHRGFFFVLHVRKKGIFCGNARCVRDFLERRVSSIHRYFYTAPPPPLLYVRWGGS